jgi:soluble lytic murein transglycosylase-like protein
LTGTASAESQAAGLAESPALSEEERLSAMLSPELAADLLLLPAAPVADEEASEAGLATAAAIPVKLPPHDPTAIRYRWQAYFGTIDSLAWQELKPLPDDNAIRALTEFPVGSFSGVGFPHIESSNRPTSKRYKPFRRMISYRQTGPNSSRTEPIPHLRCMGLSPKKVARRADRYNQQILSLAIEYEISASLVMAVVTEESCFNPKAVSPAGAMGLMQLMPGTAKWLKVRNPMSPKQNLRGGIRYLAMLHKRYGDTELALAAYNAGPGNVQKYGGIPPFRETIGYVKRVQKYYRRYVAATRLASQI